MFSLPSPNRYLPITKEYMLKFMGQERVNRNSELIERYTHNMVTESDFKSFMQFVVDVYESAYLKAIEDYRDQFKKHGIDLKITSETR